MRVGVIGNPEYPGLEAVLERLQRAAPSLGLEVHSEAQLPAVPGFAPLDEPDTDLLSANVLVVGISRADLIDVGPGLGPIHLHGGAPDQNGGVLVSLGNIGD